MRVIGLLADIVTFEYFYACGVVYGDKKFCNIEGVDKEGHEINKVAPVPAIRFVDKRAYVPEQQGSFEPIGRIKNVEQIRGNTESHGPKGFTKINQIAQRNGGMGNQKACQHQVAERFPPSDGDH